VASRFGAFSLQKGAIVYEDSAGGTSTWRAIPLGRLDSVEAGSLATEVYPSRGRVVVHAGNVRLEVTRDGPGAGAEARAFAEAVLEALRG
jgi:hypothetical protein